MPWFRVDDTFAFHHKTEAAGNAAVGLWTRAGSWSMHTLSDGFVPESIALKLGTAAQADRLLASGLWLPMPTGFAFHEWEGRNPSKADVRHMSEVKGAAGQYGNHVKWHRGDDGKPKEECSWCQKEDLL